MNEGERTLLHQPTSEAPLYDMGSPNSESTILASGGNGYMSSVVTSSSSVTTSCTSASYSNNADISSTTLSSSGAPVVHMRLGEEAPPYSKHGDNAHIFSSETSIDTYHTPSASLQNLSGSGGCSVTSGKFNGSNARRLSDIHDELIQQHQPCDQKFREEEEDPATATDSGAASIPLTVTELSDDYHREDGTAGDEQSHHEQSSESYQQHQSIHEFQQHKRQNSAGSQCSLSSNPENSQFKTADAHSSDSDGSRNSATTSGFVFDHCMGSSPTVGRKEELDRKSLQSDHSHSGEQLNTSVESVEFGGIGESIPPLALKTGISHHSVSSSSVIKLSGVSAHQGPTASVTGKPRGKKKMWYQQIFSTSYKTRSGDFKKIFKDLPPDERLIVDYSCALQKEILLQGRMYVSQNYVSFYANIFGWETQTSISFKEIESITKEKTALIIPNAIQIATMTEKYFFSSFVTRDTTYVMLFKLWQSALLEDVSGGLEKNMSKKELWRLVHMCYGEELGVTSEDESEDMFCPPLVSTSAVSSLITTSDIDGAVKSVEIDPERKSPSPENAPTITVEQYDDDQDDDGDNVEEPRIGSWDWCRLQKGSAISGLVCAGEIAPAIAVGLSIGSSIVTSNGIPIAAEQLLTDGNIVPVTIPVLPMEVSDSSDTDNELIKERPSVVVPVPALSEAIDSGPETIPSLPPVCPVDHAVGKDMLNTIIPCNIDQLFTMLFTNSKFYLDFQLSRKTTDINQSDWQLGEGSHKTRQLTFTVLTGQIVGPSKAQVTETQTLLPASRPGLLYAIQSESVNAGIPYADCFSVNCHYCLSKVSATESRINIITKVHYKKSTWAKSFIEKNSMSAMTEFFNHMERALKDECAKMNAGGLTPTSPIASNVIVRRRHPRKKCRAPDIPVSAITRPIIESGLVHPGTRSSLPRTAPEVLNEAGSESIESSLVMKIILTILGCLLLLNAFLYFKLSNLETAASNTSVMYPPPFKFSGETPQTHQEWLVLLQQQETLHRSEVHNWHEILVSAIKILHQAEKDLEHLKSHISTYGTHSVVKPLHRSPLEIHNTENEKSQKISRHINDAIPGADKHHDHDKG